MTYIFLFSLIWMAAVHAVPALVARESGSPTAVMAGLTPPQINSFNPYTYYAKAVYCLTPTIMSWSCGPACAGNVGFKPVAGGGDGGAIQYWYVGYDPKIHTVIVAHQGTNTSHLKALLTDANTGKTGLSSSLFPNLPSGIEVHRGFQDEHAKTAAAILANVQLTMSRYNVNSVTMVGHSLGAALALLEAVYLPKHLPKTTVFQSVVYGLPRVGNKDFANYVDANVRLTHINNLKDPMPIIPGKFMGYVHPAGEVHIEASGKWAICPGHDNPSPECIVGTVSSIFSANETNHDGPYNGIHMHCHQD